MAIEIYVLLGFLFVVALIAFWYLFIREKKPSRIPPTPYVPRVIVKPPRVIVKPPPKPPPYVSRVIVEPPKPTPPSISLRPSPGSVYCPMQGKKIKKYYETKGEFKGQHTISPTAVIPVNSTTCDAKFYYARTGHKIADGKDYRRFVFEPANGDWRIVSMGEKNSGKLVYQWMR